MPTTITLEYDLPGKVPYLDDLDQLPIFILKEGVFPPARAYENQSTTVSPNKELENPLNPTLEDNKLTKLEEELNELNNPKELFTETDSFQPENNKEKESSNKPNEAFRNAVETFGRELVLQMIADPTLRQLSGEDIAQTAINTALEFYTRLNEAMT